MPSRSVRSAAALALATSVTSFAYVGSVAPAQAAGYDGYCKTSSGVTVVVDFGKLGGGVAIRCAPVGSGASGQQALAAAGIPVEQPRRTPGFVCRLYGKPSATATLPDGYHEQCVNTPPTKAHWQYYQAANGGSWVSSSRGYSQSQVIGGGFEGWSFTEGSTNHAPAIAPSRPANDPPTHKTTQPPAPPRHTTTTAPKHPTASGSAPGKGGDSGSHRSDPKSTTASKASKAAKKKKAAGKKASSSVSSSSSSKAKHGKASSSSSAGSAAGTASSGSTNVAVGNSDDLIKDSKKSSSINATTVVGGGVLGTLAVGGAVVAVIRRRNLGL